MQDSRTSTDPQSQLRRACAEMDRGLRAGEDAGSESLLGRFPELAACEELSLELIYNEFVVREELGQSPRIEEWYARFPAHRERLERLFHVDELLRDPTARPSTNGDARSTGGGAPGGAARPLGWLGQYQLLEEIGRGGMGVVYKARQKGVERLVAVKMLRGPEPGSAELARLFNEAKLVGQLRHPGIVQIFEVGEHEGQPFLALEYAEGGSLDRWLDSKPLPAREAAEMTRDLCRAVQHAHEAGIIHRDLKPANVLLSVGPPASIPGPIAPGDADRRSYASPLPGGTVKITDYGLARQLSDSRTRTQSGQALGTASYMAPEQAEGRPGWARPACDIYALGAILYELLTGRPPHLDESVVRTLHLVVHADPVPPRLLRPGVPRDLETICLKCLDKDPARRYATAADLAEDLNLYLDGLPVRARPLPWPARLGRSARRHPAIAALVVVSAAALVAFVAGWAHFTRQLGVQRDLAEERREEAVEEKRDAVAARERAASEKREADAQRERAVKNEGAAQRQLDRSRRMLVTATLLRASQLGESDPVRARALLEGEELCPPKLRDFAWGVLRSSFRRRVERLPGHGTRVNAVAWSPDGKWLVSADHTGKLVVWDAATRKPLRQFAGPNFLAALAVAPDGTIAAGGVGGTSLFSADGTHLGDLPVGNRAIMRAVVFVGRDHLVSVSGDRALLWDARRGKLLEEFKGHADNVDCAAVVAGGLVATAGQDRTIRLWDVQTCKEKRPLLRCDSAVLKLAASPDGNTLISGEKGGTVLAWNVADGSRRVIFGQGPDVTQIAFSPDGGRVAWGNAYMAVRLYDLRTNTHLGRFEGHDTSVASLAWSPDGRFLVTGGGKDLLGSAGVLGRRTATAGGELRVYDLEERPGRPLALGPAGGATDVAFQGNDAVLAVGFLPGKRVSRQELRRLPLAGGQGPTTLDTLPSQARLAVTADGRFVWAAGAFGLRGREVGRSGGAAVERPASVRAMALSPDGASLALVGRVGKPLAKGKGPPPQKVRIVAAATGRLVREIDVDGNRVTWLGYSPDGKYLGLVQTTGYTAITEAPKPTRHTRLHRYDVAAGRLLPPVDITTSGAFCWMPGGASMAAGGNDGTIRVWDVATGEARMTLTGHTQRVTCLAVSPDGATLASGGHGRDVRLWDLATGQERLTLLGHTWPVWNLAFSRDGKRLVSCSHFEGGGEVLLWESE